jgi:hypothetical protein
MSDVIVFLGLWEREFVASTHPSMFCSCFFHRSCSILYCMSSYNGLGAGLDFFLSLRISRSCCCHPFSISSTLRRPVWEKLGGGRYVVVRADWPRLIHQATEVEV